jgi:hypothetical protein
MQGQAGNASCSASFYRYVDRRLEATYFKVLSVRGERGRMPESTSRPIRHRLEGAFRMAARSDQRYEIQQWIVPDCRVDEELAE